MIKVYLAGNLHTAWRERLRSYCIGLQVEFLEPRAGGSVQQYVIRDLVQIRQADIVLAFLEKWNPDGPCRHIGTSAEVGYDFALGKPIILVNAFHENVPSFEFLEAMSVSVIKPPPHCSLGILQDITNALQEAAGILLFATH